jgi:hypothetical protein
MAATVSIVEKNGAGGTATPKNESNTIRFKDADDPDVTTSNRMRVPAAGQYTYSYEKWLRLNVTVAPSTDITNIVTYLDGGNGLGTGVGLYAKAVATYATPTKPTSTTGFTDAFTYTSASPLSLGAGPFTGTGEKGDHLVMLMRLADTASAGVTPTESLIFAFDET